MIIEDFESGFLVLIIYRNLLIWEYSNITLVEKKN
jgi:hypothetical protein